jgi:acetyl-CoA carboxylase biotin carboxyl carrier protein
MPTLNGPSSELRMTPATHTNNQRCKKGHTLDIKLIKQVVDLMKRSDISEFEFEEDGFKLRLSSKGADAPQIIQAAPVAHAAAPLPVAATSAEPAAAAPAVEEKGIAVIKSPMVGTFYRSASPESPAFADVGTKASKDSIVCIIEAMKVMNEIQAEISGTITEALVENGEAVEYGQPLFKIKTA